MRDLCSDDSRHTIIVGVAPVVVLVFLTGLAILLIRYYWTEVVLLYYRVVWRLTTSGDDDSDSLMSHKMAYVVYNSASEFDRVFVHHILREKVETDWDMRLYITERDMPGGLPMGEAIRESMERCECVIILSSQSLLECSWVDFTLQHVANIRRSGLRSKICVIRLGEQPVRSSIPKEFQGVFYPHSWLPVPVLEWKYWEGKRRTWTWCWSSWRHRSETNFWRELECFLRSWLQRVHRRPRS